MKLDIVVKITSQGEHESFANNNDSWSRTASEARSYFNDSIDNFNGTSKTVVFARFLGPMGYLLCNVKASPRGSMRDDDNTATWIHFPADISISGDEVVNILKKVEEAISKPNGIDYDILKGICAKDYPLSHVSTIPQMTSQGDSVAIRYYGQGATFQLYEILGDNIAQPEYANYKCVLFIDKTSGITHKISPRVKVINPLIKPACTIRPPEPKDGFYPYLSPNIPFDKNLTAFEGSTVSLIWKKDGYASITKSFVVVPSLNMQIPAQAQIGPNEYRRWVYKKWLQVVNENGQPLDNCSILINGRQFIDDKIGIPEFEFSQPLRIVVTKNGYDRYESGIEHIEKMVKIRMKKEVNHCEYYVEAYNGKKLLRDSAKLTLDVDDNLYGSPIKGYKPEGNWLIFDKGISVKAFMLGFVSALLALLIIYGIHGFFAGSLPWQSSQKNEIENNDSVGDSDQKPDNSSSSASISSSDQMTENNKVKAIHYLDRNTIWDRDSLEANPMTKGLYDDLNQFNFNSLVEDWSNELSDSHKFSDVVDRASKALNWKYEMGKASYNRSGDCRINVEKYKSYISVNHKQLPQKNTKVQGKKSRCVTDTRCATGYAIKRKE
jgi:hypothetical protein